MMLLIAAVTYVIVRSWRAAISVFIGGVTVHAGRVFLASGLMSVLDVGLLAADTFITPVVSTWLASFFLMYSVLLASEARSKAWLIVILIVIAAISFPAPFPAFI